MAWGSRAFGPRAGLYTGLFTVTALGYFLFTRVLIPEAIVSLLIAAAFCAPPNSGKIAYTNRD